MSDNVNSFVTSQSPAANPYNSMQTVVSPPEVNDNSAQLSTPAVPPTPISPVVPAAVSPTPPPVVQPTFPTELPGTLPPLNPTTALKIEGSKKKVGGKIILFGILLLLLSGVFFGFDKVRSLISNAAGNCTPKNIQETVLSDNSVEIVFQTNKACKMMIAYGLSNNESALLLRVPEALSSLNHRIKLSPLLASTPYHYQVIPVEGQVTVKEKKPTPIRSFLTKPAPIEEESGQQPVDISPVVVPTPDKEATPEASILNTTTPIPTATATVSATPTKALIPTKALTISSTPVPTAPKYTLTDFQAQFGTSNPLFDIDKNGIVNTRDWQLYLKTGG